MTAQTMTADQADALAANGAADQTAPATAGALSRTAVLAYGVLAYAVGMGALFWVILGHAGLVPMGLLGFEAGTPEFSVLLNVGLLGAFAVQHTIMARPAFKRAITRTIPKAAERATFVLMAGLALWVAIAFWQPLPETVWSAEAPFSATLWTLFALGWGYLVAASFAINHFDLFGLRQVWLHWRRVAYRPLPFQTRWMYRFSRHPLMAGVLVGVWAVPDMTVGRLVLAATVSAYVFVGIWFEERDLIREFGEKYLSYRRQVGRFTPWF